MASITVLRRKASMFMLFVLFTSFNVLAQTTNLDSDLEQSVQQYPVSKINIELQLNNLLFYDEILTHSLRNYAYTKEEKWLVRYLEFQQLLDQAILSLSDNSSENNSLLARFIEANNSLYRYESQIIDFIKQGQYQAAIDTLEGDEYRYFKQLYEQLVEQRLGFVSQLKKQSPPITKDSLLSKLPENRKENEQEDKQNYFSNEQRQTHAIDKTVSSLTPDKMNKTNSKGVMSAQNDAWLVENLTESERIWLTKHNTWRIGIDPKAEPFEFIDESQKHSGISSDYIQYIASILNVDLQLEGKKSWKQVIAAAESKDIDVLPLAVESESRQKYLAFTTPYLSYPVAIIVRDDNFLINRQADLAKKSVALIKEYAISEIFQEKFTDLKAIFVDSIEESLKMVSSGQADALILDVATATYQIRKSNILNLRVAGYIDISAPGFSVAVRNDWQPLVGIINKVLAQMPPSKKLEFNRRWINIANAPKPSKRIYINSQEQAWLDSTPSIRVMSESDQIPFDFTLGGEPAGYSIDYIKLLAQHIGLQLEFVKGSRSKHIEGVQKGNVDLLHSLSDTSLALKGLVNYSQAYKTTLNALITRSSIENITSIEDLEGRTIALLKGDLFAKQLQQKVPDLELLLLDNNEALLKAVAFGLADATKVELPVATHLMRTLSLTNLSIVGQIHEQDDPSKQYRFAVRKDWPELISLLNKAMDALTEQDLQKLNDKWLAIDNKSLGKLVEKSSFLSFKSMAVVLLLLFIAFLVIFYLFRLLERSKSNPLSFQFSSPLVNRVAILFNVAIILVTTLLSWWVLTDLREKITKDMLASLQTVLETTGASTTIWAKGKQSNLTDLAQNPRLITIVEMLVAQHNNKEPIKGSDAQKLLRKFLTEIKGHDEQVGFFVIAPDGISIGSMRDENLEVLNLIDKNRPDLFQKSISGETLFVPPIPSDVPLLEHGNIKADSIQPTMFFATPIRNSANEIIAILAERHDPYGDFTRLHQLGRIGETGETYSISSNAKLLTESRFLNQLRKIGLLKKDAQSILSVDIQVPNSKSKPLAQQGVDRGAMKLTKMAESLTKGNSDFDTKGYLDYRGINVIGVWTWNNQLGIGTATEIDYDEAFEGYFHTRLIIIIILLITLSASVVLTLTTMLLGSRANRALLQAHNMLEQRVKKRTSELRASEQKLLESEERFDLALKGAQDGIYDWNYQTGDAFYSAQWLKMLGYKPGEISPTIDSWQQLCHPEDLSKIVEYIKSCDLSEENQFSIKFRMKHKDGHWVPILSRAYAVRDKNSGRVRRFVGTHTDLTKQREYEENLKRAIDMANDASQAKSNFLATMSHEIRTPLNGVLGMLSLMLHSELTSDQSRKLTMANQSAQSLLNIINDVLDFSKIEAGKLELEYVDFDLIRLLEDIAQTMAFKAEEKGIELLLDITQIGTTWVNGDPLRIRQVILNLVGNAIKFTDRGDILIRARLQKLTDETLTLTLSVIDSGIGIEQNKLSSLFDSFTQADTSTTRKYGGSGLGLAICKRLVALMGGSLHAESEIGQGSVFEFTAPLLSAETETESFTNIDMSKLNILIVDDNSTNREIFATHLQTWGAKTTEASSAEEAMSLCQSGEVQFDIGIIDMHMPEKNGETLAKELRQSPKVSPMKLILMTSMNKQQSNAEILALGFDGYLSKPVTTSDLFNAIVALTFQKNGQLPPNLVTESTLESYQQINLPNNKTMKEDWLANTRILVVEDNQINQMVVKGMLELNHLTCDFAENGLEALLSLQSSSENSPYTLIFMDCQMPELDGYETTRRIRSGEAQDRYKAIPIIAMTAHAMKDEMAKCIDAGMDDYLAKPLDETLLKKALQKWCGKQSSEIPNLSPRLDCESKENTNEVIQIVWDRLAFKKRLSGNQKLIDEIVKLFIQSIDNKLEELTQAIVQQDSVKIKEVAHAIKGMSGNLSGLQVQSIASDIEQNALQLDNAFFEERLASITTAIQELLAVLIQYSQETAKNTKVEKEVNAEKQAIDVVQFKEWVHKLKYSLVNGEFITPDVFESIQIYALDKTLALLIEELQGHVSMFDSDNAVKTLKKIEQQL